MNLAIKFHYLHPFQKFFNFNFNACFRNLEVIDLFIFVTLVILPTTQLQSIALRV